MNGLGDPCDIVMLKSLKKAIKPSPAAPNKNTRSAVYALLHSMQLARPREMLSPGKHWPQRLPHRLDEHCASGSSSEISLNPSIQYPKGQLKL